MAIPGSYPLIELYRVLTGLQCVGEICQLHLPQDMQCDLQKPLSKAALIFIFPMLSLMFSWVVWAQESLETLQLFLHQRDDFMLKLLKSVDSQTINIVYNIIQPDNELLQAHLLNSQKKTKNKKQIDSFYRQL